MSRGKCCHGHIRMEAKRKALEAITTVQAEDKSEANTEEGTPDESRTGGAQNWAQWSPSVDFGQLGS